MSLTEAEPWRTEWVLIAERDVRDATNENIAPLKSSMTLADRELSRVL